MIKKRVIFSLFLSVSTLISAQEIPCLDKLTHFQTETSVHFQLPIKNYAWKADVSKMSVDLSDEALLYFLRDQARCADGEVVTTTPTGCSEVFPGKSDSVSCFHEVNLGYFFITKDKQENINLLFSSTK